DLRFSVRSAKEAEILRTHREWARSLHKKAEVLLPTWGIVIHDVNVRSLGVNSPRTEELRGVQDAVISKLVAANQADWGTAEITRLNWLRTPVGKSGSLVAEFSSPVAANTAIDRGVLWDGNCLSAVLYDRATRVRQCHNCQKWGHIGTTCPTNKPTCVYCAGEHLSRSCPQKADSTLSEYKCVNCGGTHAAWATECPEREKEVERMKEMARYRPRYHPVPAYFSINAPSVTVCPSPASSWGTPVESSSSSGSTGSSGTESSDSPAVGAAPPATRSSTGLQTSQWSVVQKKKKGKKGSTTAASCHGFHGDREHSIQLSTSGAASYASTQQRGSGIRTLSQSIHAPRPSKKTPRQVPTRQRKDEVSASSSGSRKSVRIMKRVEAASQVNMETLKNHLLGDNPSLILTTSEPDQADNQSEFQPSTTGDSALTEVVNLQNNPRKRRLTATETGANTVPTSKHFWPRVPIRQHTYNKKPTRTPRL
ncbi:hypothetical protein N7504_007428, partial [Penicillium tannophilum]